MTVTTSPVRTGQAASDGSSRKALRASRGPRADRAQRRVFSNDYKLAVLADYDRCSEPGEKGALLRREGL
jgi:transposase